MEFSYPRYRENTQHLCPIPEDVAIPVDNWSGWQKLMVPETDLGGEYNNRNGGHEGSYRVGRYLPGNGVCGIYEWKMVNPDVEEDKCVVYLGSSCHEGPAPLRNRILRYCRDGDHKAELINNALRQGYELHVRHRVFEGVEQAKDAENYLLGRYNYAWNIRRNGIREPIRENLQD